VLYFVLAALVHAPEGVKPRGERRPHHSYFPRIDFICRKIKRNLTTTNKIVKNEIKTGEIAKSLSAK
jgi:hypothetical protein